MKKSPVFPISFKPQLGLFVVWTIGLILGMMLPNTASAQQVAINRQSKKIFPPIADFDESINNTFSVSSADSSFQIELPGYLTSVFDLDSAAKLQFKNIFNETYLLVFEEKIDDDALLGEQLFFYRKSFANKLHEIGGFEERAEILNINNNLASQYEVSMQVEGVELSYMVTFIEAQGKFFKIYFWTLADQKKTFFPDFKKAVNTFVTKGMI
jgi:hypothetical protein